MGAVPVPTFRQEGGELVGSQFKSSLCTVYALDVQRLMITHN